MDYFFAVRLLQKLAVSDGFKLGRCQCQRTNSKLFNRSWKRRWQVFPRQLTSLFVLSKVFFRAKSLWFVLLVGEMLILLRRRASLKSFMSHLHQTTIVEKEPKEV